MVECAGLEIRYTVIPYRGFESLPFRQDINDLGCFQEARSNAGFFVFLLSCSHHVATGTGFSLLQTGSREPGKHQKLLAFIHRTSACERLEPPHYVFRSSHGQRQQPQSPTNLCTSSGWSTAARQMGPRDWRKNPPIVRSRSCRYAQPS